jgi:outer membrane protein assembly factor BamD
MVIRHAIFGIIPVILLAAGCAKKYENPITKDTQQPDKVLFDTAVDDIEHGRYERARLTLQTMMNTYDTSEFLAKAKLAVADSWKREGGTHGLAQAEAEYKDFILFYPNMEESAEAQYKICEMQYLQMDKADRDDVHARLGDAECKDVLQKWPNSQYASAAANMERQIQEVLAEHEMVVGVFYAKKGGNGFFSAANRFDNLVRTYPLYSHADDALWLSADAYNQMGDKYENQQADDYTRIVRDYPLSIHAPDAKAQLRAMGRPVPDADPVQEARMKFEMENRTKPGLLTRMFTPFSDRPDTSMAAKSGNPTVETFKPTMPLDVPETARGVTLGGEITIAPPTRDILGSAPDARTSTNSTGTAPASGDNSAAKTGDDKPAAAASGANSAAPAANTSSPSATGAVDNSAGKAKANATAKAVNAKAKPPKAVAPKKRPRPADTGSKKSTAKPATQPAPSTDNTTPAAAPAKGSGGGGAPQAPPL